MVILLSETGMGPGLWAEKGLEILMGVELPPPPLSHQMEIPNVGK